MKGINWGKLALLFTAFVAMTVAGIVVKHIQKDVKEFFQSAGTVVQLETSHVPTEEDVRAMRQERRRVHRDLLDMTGSA